MNYSVRVRTRSAGQDYLWVGEDPSAWWSDPKWGKALLRLRPCLLRQSPDEGGQVLMTGIVSERRDGSTSQSPITYDLAALPDPIGSVSGPELMALCRAWWDQRKTAQGHAWNLGRELDSTIAEVAASRGIDVDEAIDLDDSDVTDAAITRLLQGLSQKFELTDEPASLPAVPTPVNDGLAMNLVGDLSMPMAFFCSVDQSTAPGVLASLAPHASLLVDIESETLLYPKRLAPGNGHPGPGTNPMPARKPKRSMIIWTLGLLGLVLLWILIRSLGGKSA